MSLMAELREVREKRFLLPSDVSAGSGTGTFYDLGLSVYARRAMAQGSDEKSAIEFARYRMGTGTV